MADTWQVLLAHRIADRLFLDGSGQKAQRLVLTTSDERAMGGWCKEAVIDQIVQELARGATRSAGR